MTQVDTGAVERTARMAEIATAHGVRIVDDKAYQVIGRPYHITFTGRGDCGEPLWECNCPAGQHGHECKHLRLVWQADRAICSEFGLE